MSKVKGNLLPTQFFEDIFKQNEEVNIPRKEREQAAGSSGYSMGKQCQEVSG